MSELTRTLNFVFKRLKHAPNIVFNLSYHVLRVVYRSVMIIFRSLFIAVRGFVRSLIAPAPKSSTNSLWSKFKAFMTGFKEILIYFFLGLPSLLLMPVLKSDSFRQKAFPFLPKLGVFFQHQAVETSRFYDLDEVTLEDAGLSVSIVTPSYNQGEFIEETIRSVLDQGIANLNYVVQDGGSNDSTVDVLKTFSSQDLSWESKPDKGQTQALNLGFSKLPNDEIMAYLNSDDLLLPNALKTVLLFFKENPDVDVVYGNRLLVDEDSKCIGQWVLPHHDSEVLSYADYIPQETMFWRSELWDKIGGSFDESYRFAMDWEILLRFKAAGARFYHMDKYLGAFRIHSAQKTSAIINEVGDLEMQKLRKREAGIDVSGELVFFKTLPFLLNHTFADAKKRYFGPNATVKMLRQS